MSWINKTLVFIVVISCTAAYDMKMDYDVTEGKARFKETIETNLEKNTVKYYTPAHNDVLESYKLQDFKEGLQITCYPTLQQCRLRNIDKDVSPDAGQITQSYVESWNRGLSNSISESNARVIEELYYMDGEQVSNTSSLGQNLQKFYEQFMFPLYLEKKVPQGARVYNISDLIGDKQQHKTRIPGHRVRRQFQVLTQCPGQQPEQVFGIDQGRGCNYLRICKDVVRRNGVDVFADCDDEHITQPTVYRCICCPGFTTVAKPNTAADDGMCRCAKMIGFGTK